MKRLRQPANLNTQTNTNSNTETGANISSVPSPKSVKRNRMPRQDPQDFQGVSESDQLGSKSPPIPAVENDDHVDAEILISTKNIPGRLQQSPAHINTNLMKIKLESDYVPTVRSKEEVVKVEGVNSNPNPEISTAHNDENEQTGINSSSVRFSDQFQSSSSANKIEGELSPQEPEVEHPFNCIQISRVKIENSEIEQQNDQEEEKEGKVVVKVEADWSDSVAMETSENETEMDQTEQETETVEKLEERIQKYIQKVASLHREKTEIQTSLKLEIAQLNLVVREQETKIQDLNSTITLQRDEIKELKSQLAEQQPEMEKLKGKSKSSAKRELSVENSPLKIKPNSTAVLLHIGNLPTNVLSRIFDYLDIKSLKESRFVCRLWKNEAGKILLQNFYLVCDDKERCENALINWLKNSYPNSNSASTAALKLFSGGANRTLQLLQKSPALSGSIIDLKFSELSATKILYEVLKLLPNLKGLETKSLDLNPNQKWLKDGATPNKLDLLIKKLQTLNRLKLDFGMTKQLAVQFCRHGQQFSSIKSLELHAAGVILTDMTQFMRHSLHNKNKNWAISRFTLNVDGHYVVKVIRNFLLTISPTLKHLKFILYSSQERLLSILQSPSPWTDKWLIPKGLLRVETLEFERAVGMETFVVKCIVAALRLPRLRKLTVDDVLFSRELKKEVGRWNSHESARGRKLKSKSLKELEIVPQFVMAEKTGVLSRCHQSKIPRHPWPHLKSLKCAWKNPESFEPHFLRELRNLERLELNILTGTFKKSRRNQRKNRKSSTEFQLRDLKNLKSFCLKVPNNEQRYQDFANSLVQKDLKFMKSLQSVQFHRVVIDAEPLISALGPNVSIIFTN